MRVRWLKKAKKNLDMAMEYITQDNPTAAEEMYVQIRSRVDNLAKQPGQGRPGSVFGTRELVIEKYPYLVPYRVTGNDIVILRVFHTSQRPPQKW
jgi:addiction module RelE/StbE family toxin